MMTVQLATTVPGVRAALAAALVAIALLAVPAAAQDVEASGGSGSGSGEPALPENADELDRLALASLLVQDGYYDRAATVLDEVDTARDDLDRVRFHTLRGLVRLNREESEGARADFRDAIDAGQDNPVIHVYLAQASFRMAEYTETLDAIERAGATVNEYPSLFLLQAESHWNLDQPVGALTALAQGEARFPDRAEFLRRQVFYLMELGIYRTAAERGRRYLGRIEGEAEDYLAIAVALHRADQPEQALGFLETARLRFPANAKIAKALAQVYFETDREAAAAHIYEKAAALNLEMTHEAAEYHRRAGNLFRALNLNARVRDPEKKMRQRVAILVELERFAQVTGSEAALNRAGLLQDQNIRYALAYAHFKEGAFDAAERHLNQLTEGELVRQATELRQYMQECRGDPWLCA